VKTINSLEDLRKYRLRIVEQRLSLTGTAAIHISVGLGTCGIAAGALEVLRALNEHLPPRKRKDVNITPTGCLGLCSLEPIVEVSVRGEKVTYGRVSAADARRIVEQHIVGGKVVQDLVIDTELLPTI
jgi:(2Fe-2S) ferredoxin